MAGQNLQFGDFELDPSKRVLLENGRPLRLGSRALDILIALTARPGETVTKDELIARVWPNTVVEEANLRVHVAALRKALGDGQSGNRYVTNVTGRGYAFVGSLQPVRSDRPKPVFAVENPPAAPAMHNLPSLRSRVVGRSETIEALAAQLGQHGFISIIGPGGIGKTTVAVAVAERLARTYDGGARFIDLAPIFDATLVPGTVAASLGLSVTTGTATQAVIATLRDQQMLLVLDNCEHVIEAAAFLAEQLFRSAPGVHLLATSREALRAEGEHVHRLTPLDLPPQQGVRTVIEIMRFPAVQLFAERATANGDAFRIREEEAPLVVDLCRRLDGIPLAIEFAAARVDQFGIQGLAQRLDDRFQVLTKGRRTALPRHQTLRATLDWSYQTLSPAEQAVLRRISVFAGNFTLQAACAIAVHAHSVEAAQGQNDVYDCIAALAMKSLISVDVSGSETYYRLLETTRAYAFAKLKDSGEARSAVRSHADFCCATCTQASAEWETRPAADWLAVYGGMIDDIRIALDWALSPEGDAATSLTLAALSAPLWYQLSLQDEFRGRAERALACAGQAGDLPLREIQLLIALGHSYLNTNGLLAAMPAAFARALQLARQHNEPSYEMQAIWGMWSGHNIAGEYAQAAACAEQFAVLCESSRTTNARIICDRMMMRSRHLLGDHAGGRYYAERVLADPSTRDAAARNTGFQLDQRTAANCVLSRVLWLQGYPDQALQVARDIVDHATTVGHMLSLCFGLSVGACPVALFVGDMALAARWTALLRERSLKSAFVYWQSWARCFETALAALNPATAEAQLPSRLQEAAAFGPQPLELLVIFDQELAPTALLDRAVAGFSSWCQPELLRIKGERLLREQGGEAAAEAAGRLFTQSLDLADRQGALSWALRTAMSQARLWQQQARRREAKGLLGAVYGRFSEGFATADLRQAEALLKAL